jgi:hypothetical protein
MRKLIRRRKKARTDKKARKEKKLHKLSRKISTTSLTSHVM